MEEFTRLEREVFSTIGAEHPAIGDLLRLFLRTAKVSERNNTGAGFYTLFGVDRSQPPIVWPLRWVDGPHFSVYIRDRGFPMAFILWLDNGYPRLPRGLHHGTGLR